MKTAVKGEISQLLKDLGVVTIPSRAEELEMHSRYLAAEGDERIKARNEMAKHYIPFVIKCARKAASSQCERRELGDLIHDGFRGLCKAIDKFDPSKGRLTTYSHWWIDQYIDRGRMGRAYGKPFRVPFQIHSSSWTASARQRKEYGEGRHVTLAEAAKIQGGRVEKDSRYFDRLYALQVQNFDSACDADDIAVCDRDADEQDEGFAKTARVSVQNIQSPKERIDPQEWADVCMVMSNLSERERCMIRLKFGIDGEKLTLREIGDLYGISHERVRQIINSAIKELRESVA